MDADALDDLLRRLTALVVKIDERDTQRAERFAHYDAILDEQRGLNARLTTAIERIDGTLAQLGRTQADITALLAKVFESGENGHERH
jgi:hypothetical protein